MHAQCIVAPAAVRITTNHHHSSQMVSKAKPVVKKSKSSEGKVKRAPSAYNMFMKSECLNLKKANPSLSAKDIFKRAAESWKNSPSNPKNGSGKK